MYLRVLGGYGKALGPDHISTLDTVNNLGNLYRDQGKLAEAEQMYVRALAGKERTLRPDDTSTLDTVNNLGPLGGVDMNVVNKDGFIALCAAAQNGHELIVKLLITG